MNEPPTAQWARNDRVLDTSSETSQGSPSIVATRLLGASAVACAPALIELLASILGTRSTISITVGAMLGGTGRTHDWGLSARIVQTCAVKAPGYGERRKAMRQDIATLTGGTAVMSDLGMIGF